MCVYINIYIVMFKIFTIWVPSVKYGDFMAYKNSMKQKGVAGSGWPDTTRGGGRAHRMSMAKAQPSNQQNDERGGILQQLSPCNLGPFPIIFLSLVNPLPLLPDLLALSLLSIQPFAFALYQRPINCAFVRKGLVYLQHLHMINPFAMSNKIMGCT